MNRLGFYNPSTLGATIPASVMNSPLDEPCSDPTKLDAAGRAYCIANPPAKAPAKPPPPAKKKETNLWPWIFGLGGIALLGWGWWTLSKGKKGRRR